MPRISYENKKVQRVLEENFPESVQKAAEEQGNLDVCAHCYFEHFRWITRVDGDALLEHPTYHLQDYCCETCGDGKKALKIWDD